MRADVFRFSPPLADLPVGVPWALARSFAPADSPSARQTDAEAALSWSRDLSLLPRIASRIPAKGLVADLGPEAAERLSSSYRSSVARALLLQETIRAVARAAVVSAVPVILLKGAALDRAGIVAGGSRDCVDVDLLVGSSRVEEWKRAIEAEGYAAPRSREVAQHLPTLSHGSLLPIEAHLTVPGVFLRGTGRVTAEALLADGLTGPVEGSDVVLVPVRQILAAHCLAHALFQHRYAPRVCPLLRAVADLLDVAGGSAGLERLVAEAKPYLGDSLSGREVQAVARLGVCLAAGEVPGPGEDADALLRHAICGVSDRGYRRRLRRRAGLAALVRMDWLKLRSALRPS